MTEDDADDWTTELVPTSEWKWNRYRVTFNWEYGPNKILYLVSTATHLVRSIQDKGEAINRDGYRWDCNIVKENVPAPKQIGVLYGMPMYSDGWE